MIFTFSIISGFRALLGSIGVQLAMFLALLFLVKVPQQTYINEPFEGANAEVAGELSLLRSYLLFNHFLCGAIIITGQRVLPGFFTMVQCLTILAMMSQIVSLILVCQNLFITDKAYDQANLTFEFEEFTGWLSIELWTIIGIIAANSVFLFFRSIFAQRMNLYTN